MMNGHLHEYDTTITWTGNLGTGTSGYKHYSRDFTLEAAGKAAILGSSDRTFHGTPSRWNPEDMLVAALSACHKLSYLHLCAIHDLVVTAYIDHAHGRMRTEETGAGRFEEVVLRPEVTIAAERDATESRKRAETLHHRAHELCFIANSVNFPVRCEPTILVGETAANSAREFIAQGHPHGR